MTRLLANAAEAEREAERLRHELTDTLDQLLDNLVPQRLAAEAVLAAGARTPQWLKDYWAFARSPVGLGLIGATAASITLGLTARRRIRVR